MTEPGGHNARIIAEFRANHGQVGGGFAGAPLLLLHTTSFRFCDTAIAKEFDVVLKAEPEQMAADVHFGRDNRLLRSERYRAVAFRKRP